MTLINTRTFKREVALGLLIYCMALGIASLFLPLALEALKLFIVPSFTFAGLAWGLESYAKQIKGK